MENQVKIVRYSSAINFGEKGISNLQAFKGTEKEVWRKAQETARRYGVEVEAVT